MSEHIYSLEFINGEWVIFLADFSKCMVWTCITSEDIELHFESVDANNRPAVVKLGNNALSADKIYLLVDDKDEDEDKAECKFTLKNYRSSQSSPKKFILGNTKER